ncbi:MAG: APC family permease [Comamonadaceae bacterium]|nr:APC family permease [Comamonadaceae bacterium]MBN9366454.1 APC family permease [Comamonadaceae bacterium]
MPAVHRADTATLRAELTAPKIIFFVIAAASPLAAMIGLLPLAFIMGAGAATPAMYLIAAAILLCFSVGYAAMSRQITNAGGLYTYIAAGLGRPVAVAAGLIGLLAYNAFSVMLVAAFGYFCELVFSASGLHLPWQVFAGVAIVLTAWLGYRRIDLSARVLALLVVAEIGVLLAIDAVFIHRHGLAAFPLAAFDVAQLPPGFLAVGLMFAFSSFLGFEAAALYGEESRNPKRTVPLATYASVIVIALFYGLTSWVAVGAIGPGQIRAEAASQLGELYLHLVAHQIGQTAADLLSVLLLTSLFATLLASHNSTNRLVFALGRENVLPRALGRVHPVHGSPSYASLMQSAINVVVIGAFALAGLEPYTTLSVSMTGLGTLGVVLMQAATAFAVIGYFHGRPDHHWWRTLIAPALGGLGLTTAVVLIVANYAQLTGVDNPLINHLPWVLVAAALGGIAHALWLRRKRPHVYAAIGTQPKTHEL